MEYKKAIISKVNYKPFCSINQHSSISDTIDNFEKTIHDGKMVKLFDQVDTAIDTNLDYEIMNMCNMLTNKYGDLGFLNKDNVYTEFIKNIKKHIKIEHNEDDYDADDYDADEF